ncbi:TPA: arginase family protein, partial [Staphylococcus pseudintermedius]
NYLYLDKTVKTYVSIDLDVFDPSIISAVTFPVSGGIDIEDYERLLEGLKELNIIGVDVVEYNVTFDYNSQNASTINLIIYKIIKMLQSIR